MAREESNELGEGLEALAREVVWMDGSLV